MKRLVMMVLVLVAIGGTTEASAQSWLDQLGKKVKEKAKDKVEQKILQKPSRRKREGRKYWPVRDTMFLRKKFLMATLFQG